MCKCNSDFVSLGLPAAARGTRPLSRHLSESLSPSLVLTQRARALGPVSRRRGNLRRPFRYGSGGGRRRPWEADAAPRHLASPPPPRPKVPAIPTNPGDAGVAELRQWNVGRNKWLEDENEQQDDDHGSG